MYLIRNKTFIIQEKEKIKLMLVKKHIVDLKVNRNKLTSFNCARRIIEANEVMKELVIRKCT